LRSRISTSKRAKGASDLVGWLAEATAATIAKALANRTTTIVADASELFDN